MLEHIGRRYESQDIFFRLDDQCLTSQELQSLIAFEAIDKEHFAKTLFRSSQNNKCVDAPLRLICSLHASFIFIMFNANLSEVLTSL